MIKKILMSIALACASISFVSCEQANAAKALVPSNWGLHWVDTYVTINGVQYPAHIEWYGSPDSIELSTATLYVRLGFPSFMTWSVIPNPGRFITPTITRIGGVDTLPGAFFPNPSTGKTPGMSL